MPVISIEAKVMWAYLCYTQDYLMPDIGYLIQPAAMEKNMSFPAKIHRVML